MKVYINFFNKLTQITQIRYKYHIQYSPLPSSSTILTKDANKKIILILNNIFIFLV